jgi:hypothetical protein
LLRVIQQYPRTDAAAAAAVALVRIAEDERNRMAADIESLRNEAERQRKLTAETQKSIEEIRKTPPKTVIVQAPPPKAKPKPAPKPAPKKKPPVRRR